MRVRPCLLAVLLFCLGCEPGAEPVHTAAPVPLQLLLQPLGMVDAAHVDSAATALEREHHAVVHIAAPLEPPASAFTKVRSPRYRADSLIAWLRSLRGDSVDHVIGLTAFDISITKYDSTGAIKEPVGKYRDFGIFGLGYVGGPACVVSMFRLGDGRSPRFFDRLKKITVHEVGHNRSLPHCADPRCVMRDAVERITSIDEASATFCPACRARMSAAR